MSGALQAVFQNQRSFGLSIGDAYEGGFYAGQISTAGDGIADYNLVVAPKSSGQSSTSIKWKTTNTSTSGTSSSIDGPTNSANMNNATHPAAKFCEDLSIGGFSDWYLPARNELEVCYYNLKTTTQTNNTDGGNAPNTNAVPSRATGYTSGVPGQTSAASFKTGGAEAFTLAGYWTSTEATSTNGWAIYMPRGYQFNVFKTTNYYVRAVRRVAV